MPQSITQAFVIQWDKTIVKEAQQADSRLEPTVHDRGKITGESFTANRLAALDDTPENDTRHGDTEWSDIQHSTRICPMKDFYQALPVDRADEEKVLANPKGAYSESLTAAWNRRKDRIILSAILGTSQLKDGGTVSLPASQIILHGSTGFTKAKAILARKNFRKNEADQHNGKTIYIAYTAEMLEDILADTTLTSSEFLAGQMLQEGDVARKWLGMTWVPYEAVPFSGGTYRTAAWTDSAVHKGLGFMEGRASVRHDKKDTLQLSLAGSYGAVRVAEVEVMEIQFQ